MRCKERKSLCTLKVTRVLFSSVTRFLELHFSLVVYLWLFNLGARLTCQYEEESVNTTFLGLETDNHLSWKCRFDQIDPELSVACCIVRFMPNTSKLTHQLNLFCIFLLYNEV
jgi:hypothetical protein